MSQSTSQRRSETTWAGGVFASADPSARVYVAANRMAGHSEQVFAVWWLTEDEWVSLGSLRASWDNSAQPRGILRHATNGRNTPSRDLLPAQAFRPEYR